MISSDLHVPWKSFFTGDFRYKVVLDSKTVFEAKSLATFMPLTIGSQIGSHLVTAFLGRGGMGEVYRARDTKLKREVAVKILPDEFSDDEERVARFQREAEVLASLNHVVLNWTRSLSR